MAFRSSLVLVLSFAALACSGPTPSSSAGSFSSTGGYGSLCTKDSDCASTNAGNAATVGSLVCGVNAQGQGACVESCTGSYGTSVPQGTLGGGDACINGKMTPCQQLPTATTCGCGCPQGTYCVVSADGSSGQCEPSLVAGASCYGDAMCQTNQCFVCSGGSCSPNDLGGAVGTCSVPLGAPCTGTSDCTACMMSDTDGGQPSWCSIPCWVTVSPSGVASNDCPEDAVCLGAQGGNSGYCYEQCKAVQGYGLTGTTGCPGATTCQQYDVGGNVEQTGTFEASGWACY